jgi:hypothetical protein
LAAEQQVWADAGTRAKAAADALAAATAAANQEGLEKLTDEKQATDAEVTGLAAETHSTDAEAREQLRHRQQIMQ